MVVFCCIVSNRNVEKKKENGEKVQNKNIVTCKCCGDLHAVEKRHMGCVVQMHKYQVQK